MENLRAAIEQDLGESIEGEFGLPVVLTSPDGATQQLTGQVLYYSRRENPATGEIVVVNQPVVVLRISSLDRVPAAGERWLVSIPTSPQAGATSQTFIFTADRSPEHGTDIGFMRIYPHRIEQEGAGPEPVS